MKKLIVTGCNGQLGREINRFYGDNADIVLVNTDVEELDITNINAVTELVNKEKPYAIINCAAYTAVDACETNRDTAFKVNVIGPRNLAIAAQSAGAKIVHISTDYVFDGRKETPYFESDNICPQSVYGETKAEAEKMVTMFSDRFFIFRTAWLYGDGKNFVKTMLRLSEDHDKVRVVGDQFGTPTSTAELVKAIDSILFTDNYGIYHATCEGSCNWAEFAAEIFRLAGKSTVVEPITTAEYGAAANRPAHSILENRMLKAVGGYTFADWHDAIKVYIDELSSDKQ
ncbi:MAG: dTDP-4-dehydrorhamnose reductase [Lachnospiraceae bacterium]|nr:dTDP-4-dehydrorhamnose reductase [Lachnospiraceae bacterium]